MKNIIYSFLTCLFIILPTQAATNFSGGNGTKQNPYLISSKTDMENLAINVNNADYYLGRYFLLTQDLIGITRGVGNGLSNLPFKGTFDGGGHTIDVDINNSYWGYGGLFAIINNATIKNLRITGSIVSRDSYSGGICGWATSSTISNCINDADIISDISAGGICGLAQSSTIINCLNTGNIYSDGNSGGICGNTYLSDTKISRCIATNKIITGSTLSGRIMGSTDGTNVIEDCYADTDMEVNRKTISSQNPSDRNGKDLEKAPFCANKPTVVFSKEAFCALRWERKLKNSAEWEMLNCTDFIYKETNQTPGIYQYRAFLPNESYTEIIEIDYLDEFTSEITITASAKILTVHEKLSLSLNISNSAYQYQWYKNGVKITNATNSTLTVESVSFEDAGLYTCEVSNPCSKAVSNAVRIEVNRITQTINFPEIPEKTFGDNSFVLPEVTDKGMKILYESNNTSVAITNGNVVTIAGAGIATITAKQSGNSIYEEAFPVSRTLTVRKVNQTITMSDIAEKTYGDFAFTLPGISDKGLSIVYSSSNPNIISISGNTLTILNAGTVEITASQPGNSNVNAAVSVTKTIKVNKAYVKIEVKDVEKVYGEPNPSYSVWYTGLRNNETPSSFKKMPTITTAVTTLSNAGVYGITIGGAESDKYDFSYVNGKFTITKAPLDIYAICYHMPYGHTVPKYKLHFIGMKGNDTSDKLDELPLISCNIPENAPLGEYTITLSNGKDKNYAYNLHKGYVWVEINNGYTGNIQWDLTDGKLTLSGSGEMLNYIYDESIKMYSMPWKYFKSWIDEISLSDEISVIGDYAFFLCSNATSFKLPAKLQSIGSYVFYGCETLQSITLPAQLRFIDECAFIGCSSLSKISIHNAEPPVLNFNVFDVDILNSCTLEVPIGSGNIYKANAKWGMFKNIVEVSFYNAVSETRDTNIKLFKSANGITIDGLNEGDTVQIFNLSGKLIYSDHVNSNKKTLHLPAKGVYILKTGSGYYEKFIF